MYSDLVVCVRSLYSFTTILSRPQTYKIGILPTSRFGTFGRDYDKLDTGVNDGKFKYQPRQCNTCTSKAVCLMLL